MKLLQFSQFFHSSCSILLFFGLFISIPITPVSQASQLTVAQAQPRSRTRVAILDFDLTDTSGNYFSYTFRGGSLARGISDLLTNKLVQNGSYSVVERSRIDAVLREQNFGATGRVDPSTAAEIGRILGVDYILLGSVTRFNLEQEQRGGGINICLPFVGCHVGVRITTRTANVQLAARLVNTTTAEIVKAAEATGEEKQQSGSGDAGGVDGGSGTDNTDNLISSAAEKAIDQLVSKLATSSTTSNSTPSRSTTDALIADVTGNSVIINQGTQNGLQTGMVLSIERTDREVTDPQTGEVIRTLTSPIGKVELTDVDARSSIGKVLSGTGFQIGDRARVIE